VLVSVTGSGWLLWQGSQAGTSVLKSGQSDEGDGEEKEEESKDSPKDKTKDKNKNKTKEK